MTGLLRHSGGAQIPVETVRGGHAVLYGQGLYRYDTVFAAAGQRGTDLVVLAVVVPLLAWSLLRYRRRVANATPLLAGALLTVLYVYAGSALGTIAYNRLFLVYVAISSASLFGFLPVFSH